MRRIGSTRLGFGLIAAAGIGAVMYTLAERPSPPPPAPAAVDPAPAAAQAPPPPSLPYAQYRTGNTAARAIYAQGAVMWVGTTGGLVRYDTRSGRYDYFDKRNGLASNAVYFVGGHRGDLLIGTNGGGLAVRDARNGSWKQYGVAEGLPDARVFGALEAADGDLWIATWAGIVRAKAGALANPQAWRHYTVANTTGGLAGDRVYALAQDRGGAIWAATQGGVSRYRNGKWASWGASGAAAVDAISVAVGADGTVWVGTLGAGLRAFDGKRWRSYTKNDGLPGDHVFALHADGEGRVWIGTNEGLARFEAGTFSVLAPESGLVGRAVFSLTAPPDGTVWAGGNGGVAHLRKLDWRAAR